MKSRRNTKTPPKGSKKLRTKVQTKVQISTQKSPTLPRKFRTKLANPFEAPKRANVPLDKKIKKTRLGRPGVNPRETLGRAYGFELMLKNISEKAFAGLILEETTEGIIAAFGDDTYHRERLACGPLPRLILEARKDHDWPTKRREEQIRFLARSMAAFGTVSARRSRAVCKEEEKRQERR